MRQAKGPRRILEIGPGTGAVTQEIVHALKPGDRLDIVEINADFIAVLERRFAEEPEFRRRRDQTKLIHSPLQEVPGRGEYDFMISGLPLNNFPLSLVDDIFKSYRHLLKAGGTLSYFEYVWIRDLKTPFVAESERIRLTKLSSILEEEIRKHQVAEEVVMLNVPPAVARHLQFVQAPG
jgi:phospholipid N-methyltransferase